MKSIVDIARTPKGWEKCGNKVSRQIMMRCSSSQKVAIKCLSYSLPPIFTEHILKWQHSQVILRKTINKCGVTIWLSFAYNSKLNSNYSKNYNFVFTAFCCLEKPLSMAKVLFK